MLGTQKSFNDISDNLYPIVLVSKGLINAISKEYSFSDFIENKATTKQPNYRYNHSYPNKPENFEIVEKFKFDYEMFLGITFGSFLLIPFMFIIFCFVPALLFSLFYWDSSIVLSVLRIDVFGYLALFGVIYGIFLIVGRIVGDIVEGTFLKDFKKVVQEKKYYSSNDYMEMLKEYENEISMLRNLNRDIDNQNSQIRIDFENRLRMEYSDFLKNDYIEKLKPICAFKKSFDNKIRGKSELYFLKFLLDEFGEKIQMDVSPDNLFYFPDFVYYCDSTFICIDIEIDEPYSFSDKSPIHYKGCNDAVRNSCFLEQNWIVVRFTEEQVVKQPKECIATIKSIIKSLLNRKIIYDSFVDEIPIWTYEEALLLGNENFRSKYLSII